MTTIPKTLSLPLFLTVKTLKLIAPRLLDYLQHSCCFDHLKNEHASPKEVCLQEALEFLLNSHPAYLTLFGQAYSFFCNPGEVASSLSVSSFI